jgi:hypothetical protein
VQLRLLPPGSYALTVILDENRNGRWDGGLLLEGRQPELVFPYSQSIQLKAGWENMIDFEPAPASGGKVLMGDAPPQKE